MKRFLDGLAVMLGREPYRPGPEAVSPAARALYAAKRMTPEQARAFRAELAAHRPATRWRNRRWVTLIIVNLLFVVSFQFDVQLVEGALTASRVLGFHLADLNSALQVMLAYKHVLVNLLIGTLTVFLLWWLLGGRTFCSWACPYHLLAEWTEHLHLCLAARGWVRDHPLHRGTRTVLYGVFALLALATGYTVFEAISPVGILSRALIYGPGLALAWVGLLLAVEVFYSRRAWCRYGCPVGLTYGVVGALSPTRVVYNLTDCHHEGECRKVCMVPHVLACTVKGRSPEVEMAIGPDCTRCARCLDACPTGALRFEVKGLSRLL